ncbi:MAG: LON peptidase substrate-binding domain-containing protein [Betaproteobacteria bacterium]
MHPSSQGEGQPSVRIPLFPLRTVLFPGGHLALRIFEQRYLAMAKARLSGESPFGVCLITLGDEVAAPGAGGAAPEFAPIGTLARIQAWDMVQLGILQVTASGGTRFKVRSHTVQSDGLVVADVDPIAPAPPVALPDAHRPLAELLELLVARFGPENFPQTRDFGDASWVGYRLAELLPLPIATKQRLLETDDAPARLATLQRFIAERGLL